MGETGKTKAWRQVREAVERGSPEDVLTSLGIYFEQDALVENQPLVVELLQNLSETMHAASVDYYVSTK